MICPECEKGMVEVQRTKKGTILIHPKKYSDLPSREAPILCSHTPCPRCNGSGTAYSPDVIDTRQPDPIIDDLSRTKKVEPMVA